METTRTLSVIAATLLLSTQGNSQEAYRNQRRLESFAASIENCAEIDRLKKQNDSDWAELASRGAGGEMPRPAQPDFDVCAYISESASSYLANQENTVWTEKPTTVGDAVWEAVFVPLNDERNSRNSAREIEVPERYRNALSQRRLARGGNSVDQSSGQRASIEVHGIEARLIQEVGLEQAQIDALFEYAEDALTNEGENLRLSRQQVVCNRSDLFETPAAYGRAFSQAAAIARAGRDRVAAGLEDVLGTETAAKVVDFALSTVGPSISTTDVEAGMSQLSLAELEAWTSFVCATGTQARTTP